MKKLLVYYIIIGNETPAAVPINHKIHKTQNDAVSFTGASESRGVRPFAQREITRPAHLTAAPLHRCRYIFDKLCDLMKHHFKW